MKKLLLFIILISQYAFSQVKMQGLVTDSLDNTLELANIVAINKATNALESYAVTNEKGLYALRLSKNTTYNIQVSYIGLKTLNISLSVKEDDIKKDFKLMPDTSLDTVELTYEMPVTIKGDTLIYNADSFKNGSERKLEDVLKKLPGVEINDNGQIEIEGQVVRKVMVEGKDFFDGDSKLATKNIPSNAVDKVQVLKNYAEVGQLRNVQNNQDSYAINIKLKEGKSNFWFGDITVGAGASTDNELYLVQPKLFYYSPKYSINVIGDLNNTGEPALTAQDLRGFGGGFRAPSRGTGTNLNLGNNDLSFLNLENNQAENIESQLLAGNFSYSPKTTLDLSGYAIFNSSRIDIKEINDIEYPESAIPDENTNQSVRQGSDVGLLKLSAVYKPNINNQLDYDVLGRLTKDTQNQTLFSSIIGDTKQYEENNPYSINQNLNYYYTLNENNIFAIEAQHLLQDEDPFYNATLEDKDNYQNTADAIGLDPNQENYNFAQDQRIKSNQLDAKLDYWNILNAKSNINFYLGTILSKQNFDSRIFQFLDNGSISNPTPADNSVLSTNDVEYNFSDIYFGARYTLKSGKFIFSPGVSFHAYSNKNTQLGQEFGEDFYRVLPDVEVRFQLKNSESIRLIYNMQNQFTDVTNLAEGLVLNNFNNLFIGESGLENGLSHNINLIYTNFNLFNFQNIFARISYNNRIDQIRNITNFESVIRNSTVFNSPFSDETITANGRYQRTFGKIQVELAANFNYNKFNQLIADTRSTNESYTQFYRPGVSTNFREAPNVSFRYGYTIQDNEQGSNKTKFYTNAPSIEFDAYLWKSLTLKTDYNYNRVSDKNVTLNTFDIWNASLAYRKNNDAKWEYQIRATNLLNTQSRVNTSSGDLSVNVREYFIQPRFVTFRVTYTI